jgi:hypothetical protein
VSDRTKLDAGKAVVKVLPGGKRDLTIFAAVRVDAPRAFDRVDAANRTAEEPVRAGHRAILQSTPH